MIEAGPYPLPGYLTRSKPTKPTKPLKLFISKHAQKKVNKKKYFKQGSITHSFKVKKFYILHSL